MISRPIQTLPDPDVQRAVENFLVREAGLLDNREFAIWLGLFAVDASYEIQCLQNRHVTGSRAKTPGPVPKTIATENVESLRVRTERLLRGLAGSEFPASLTRRFVTNITADRTGQGHIAAQSNIAVFQARKGQDWIVGSRRDLLSDGEAGLVIVQRTVTLDFEVLPRSITILL
jgi:3-phenylpropionate/trans-cinnamate dioxygenase beta subunit